MIETEELLSADQVVVDGRYRLGKKLGQGGFGVVWKATDTKTGQEVALKTLLSTLRGDKKAAMRFRREITTAARLDHHRIVKLLDAGHLEDDRPFFTMEFLDGKPLESYVHDPAATLELFDQLLEALSYAHARGVIHRDLKPDNVLILVEDDALSLKLLDFGIAMMDEGLGAGQADASLTRPGVPIGTVPYMSPEQARGEPSSVGPASDLYSLGVMLFEAASGNLPFKGDWMFVLVQHVSRSPAEFVPREGYDALEQPVLEALIGRLLRKPFTERPECAAHVRHSLAGLRASLSPSNATPIDPVASSTMKTSGAHTVSTGPASLADRLPADSARLDSPSLLRLQEAPVVGRGVEQSLLWETASTVASSKTVSAVVLTGPMQSGKSRLGRWLAEEAHQAGLMRVLYIYVSDGGLPGAMHSAIYRWLRLPKLERAPLMRRIEESLNLNESDREELCDFLLSCASTLPSDASQRQRWLRLWQKFVWEIGAHPEPRPLLVWIDGPSSGGLSPVAEWLDLLMSVARLANRALMVVWTVDAGAKTLEIEPSVGSLLGRREVEAVTIGPLSLDAQARLARFYAPDLANETVRILQERASGSPLFLREMLLDWLDEGALRVSEEGLKLGKTAQLETPIELEEVLIQRLEHYWSHAEAPDTTRTAMMALAFLGQSFPLSLCNALLEGSPVTAAELLQGGFLEQRPGALEPEVSFAARLMRDVLQSMAKGRGLERDLQSRAVMLRWEQGLKAMITGDWELAERSLNIAWALLDSMNSEDTALMRLEVLDLMACLAFRRRETALLIERADRFEALGTRLSAEHGQRSATLAALWRGAASNVLETFVESAALLEEAHTVATRNGFKDLEARALHGLGQMSSLSGDKASALQRMGEASLAFRQIDRGVMRQRPLLGLLEADAVSDQASTMAEQGDLVAASFQLGMLMDLYRTHGDKQGLSYALMKLGRIHRQLDHPAKMSECIKEARELLQQIDDRRGLALLKWEEGMAAFKIDDLEGANAHYMAAGRLFATIQDKSGEASCLNALGEIARKAGELEEAVAHYTRFRDVMAEVGHTHGHGLAEANLGWTYLAAHDHGSAQRHFHRAFEVLEQGGPRPAVLSAMSGWSLASIQLGDTEGVINTLENMIRLSEGRPVVDDDTLEALGTLRGLAEHHNLVTIVAIIDRIPKR